MARTTLDAQLDTLTQLLRSVPDLRWDNSHPLGGTHAATIRNGPGDGDILTLIQTSYADGTLIAALPALLIAALDSNGRPWATAGLGERLSVHQLPSLDRTIELLDDASAGPWKLAGNAHVTAEADGYLYVRGSFTVSDAGDHVICTITPPDIGTIASARLIVEGSNTLRQIISAC